MQTVPVRLVWLAVLCWAATAACARPPAEALVPVEDGRLVMGTVLDVSLRVSPGSEESARTALERAFGEVARLEAVASRYDSQSALSRLNAAAGQGAHEVPPDLMAMLARAEEARRLTRGAFDVRVGPLVALWVEAARLDRRPEPAAQESARQVAAQPLGLLPDGRVRLAAGSALDLGGLAKGFALDRIVGGAGLASVPEALLSFGGSSVWAGGRSWRLRIDDDEGRPLGVVALRDRALSMSSSLSQSSEIEGVRYGHVIDPRSGEPIRERRAAVVVARTATRAEILSTALLVLDENEGRAVLARGEAEAWVLREDGSTWETPGWRATTSFEPSRSASGSRGRSAQSADPEASERGAFDR